jgi:hypothetical protein
MGPSILHLKRKYWLVHLENPLDDEAIDFFIDHRLKFIAASWHEDGVNR